MTADPFWSDPFHWSALAAGFQAWAENRLDDSAYVKQLAYESHKAGEFKERAASLPAPPRRDDVAVRAQADQ